MALPQPTGPLLWPSVSRRYIDAGEPDDVSLQCESVLQSSHTPTIVPEPSFPGWMRRSHTAQTMRKCLLYAPIQIISCADCRLDCVVGNSTVARLRRRFDCERSRLVARAQNRAKIVFDCRTANDPAAWHRRFLQKKP